LIDSLKRQIVSNFQYHIGQLGYCQLKQFKAVAIKLQKEVTLSITP